MTDEEMAKKYAIGRTYPKFETDYIANFVLREVEGAYLAGFNVGKDMNVPTKWHKVADGDFPPEYTEVLNDDGVKVIRINGHWKYVYGGEWEDDAYVDYWCEIPKFKEDD